MPISASKNIVSTPLASPAEAIVEEQLREGHGIFRVGFVESQDDLVDTSPISLEQVEGRTFRLSSHVGGKKVVAGRFRYDRDPEVRLAISSLAVRSLELTQQDQSSRGDVDLIGKYMGTKPRMEQDPTDWIFRNPFIFDLVRHHSKYGNVIRYVCEKQGLFLKVGNYATQRAYWNSTLNGGLPIVKKSDPEHEGTFMLHDIYHFVPVDPVVGIGNLDSADMPVYIAHRLMSEATTLVLADMVGVADSDLDSESYDLSKRQIYPVYRSIVEANNGKKPKIENLLAANAFFCFTGDPLGFKLMGASPEALAAYTEKYGNVFRDDFMWNLNNANNVQAEIAKNPQLREYYDWLKNIGEFPSLDKYKEINDQNGEGIDITTMLSLFRAEFTKAERYTGSVDNNNRYRIALKKYFAGQRIIFSRYASNVDPSGHLQEFEDLYERLSEQNGFSELKDIDAALSDLVIDYVDRLGSSGVILPHEVLDNKFAAPQYPVRFISYERTGRSEKKLVADSMRKFIKANGSQLGRLLQIASS